MSSRLVDVLTAAQITALVAGYRQKPAVLANAAEATYSGLYPEGSPALNGFIDAVFTHGSPPAPPTSGIRGADRQRSIVAILASRASVAELAVHLYCGIGEGVTVEELCQTMLLVGGYSGYANYTAGLQVLSRTLKALHGLFPAAGGALDPVDPGLALKAIQKEFAG